MRYTYRDPHVEAVQFEDGKPKAVRDFLGDVLIRAPFSFYDRADGAREVKEGNKTCWFRMGKLATIHDRIADLYPGSWLVRYADGKFEVLTDEAFVLRFEVSDA